MQLSQKEKVGTKEFLRGALYKVQGKSDSSLTTKGEHLCEIRLKKSGKRLYWPRSSEYMSQQNLFPLDHMQLESLPKMNRRVQSDTTSILVRQLICLLNTENREHH